MDYLVVGLNHKTAPLTLREKLAFSDQALPLALNEMMQLDPVKEGLILSTCNRVEVYAAIEDADRAYGSLKDFLSARHSHKVKELDPYLYQFSSYDAVLHGFRVASSLDSMVLGENQIVGQMKKAFEQALKLKSSGAFLNQLMHRALFVAKKVRTETQISQRLVSVGSYAAVLAKQIFDSLDDKKLCLMGAGEVGELVMAALKNQGMGQVVLVNRSIDKAQKLVNQYGGEVSAWEDSESVVGECDVVITSVSQDGFLFSYKQIERLMHQRKNKPLFLIDLGVPRNLDPRIADLANVYLYNIDDLKKVVDSNADLRNQEAQKAMTIIEKEASTFYQSVIHHKPTATALSQKVDKIRENELAKTLAKMPHLSQADKEQFEKCTQSIAAKILHDPLLTMRTTTHENEGGWHHLLRKLFRLEEDS